MAAEVRVRVGTLNVHGWRAEDGGHNADALAETIAAAQLDVVGLQEVLPDRRHRGSNVLQRIATITGLPHICWYGRVAVLSRYRLHSPGLICKTPRPARAQHGTHRGKATDNGAVCGRWSGGALPGTIGKGGEVRLLPEDRERSVWHRMLTVTVAVPETFLVPQPCDDDERGRAGGHASLPPALHPAHGIVITVTHLDHVSEPIRLEQIGGVLATIRQATMQCTRGDGDAAEARSSPRLPAILLGDLNALTRTDYTDAAWAQILRVRKTNRWELPVSEVTDHLRADGWVDCWAAVRPPTLVGIGDGNRGSCNICHGGGGGGGDADADGEQRYARAVGPISTCRFDTRIDYVLANAALLEQAAIVACDIVATGDATDHELVVAEFCRNPTPRPPQAAVEI
eukprot:m.259593 g.259593  ORF g.259593 m.259593 type:complete len:399 (+) comp26640_c0_seq1:126-1322(+)